MKKCLNRIAFGNRKIRQDIDAKRQRDIAARRQAIGIFDGFWQISE